MNKLFTLFFFFLLSVQTICQQFAPENILLESETNFFSNYAHVVNFGDNIDILFSEDTTLFLSDYGEGGFNLQNNFQEGSNMARSGDFDNDGDVDLIMKHVANSGLHIYLNDGNQDFVNYEINSPSGTYRSLTVDDLNLDGFLDVLVAVPNANSIFWMENLGEGVFNDPVQIAQGLSSVTTFSVVDFDNDGDKDVVTSELFGGLYWYENDGSEAFTEVPFVFENPNFYGAWSICIEDFDQDGDMDIAVITSAEKLIWFSNNGDGTISEGIFICDEEHCSIGKIKCGDIDNDGDIDLINSRGSWFENDGTGDFVQYNYYSDSYFIQSTIELIDMDNDGDLDVLCAVQSPIDGIVLYENVDGEGCMDAAACNFDVNAFTDNGSCCFGVCGCIDPMAINYLENAECNDGSCQYEIDDVSVTENSINQSFLVYPNPMKDFSILKLPEGKEYEIKMYSLIGELINDFGTIRSSKLIIERKSLRLGVYVIEIVDVENNIIDHANLIVE